VLLQVVEVLWCREKMIAVASTDENYHNTNPGSGKVITG
jgi:hypothetical protein